MDEQQTHRIVGHALTFRALVDFTCRKHFTESGWEEATVFNELLRKDLQRTGDERLAANIDRMTEQIPLRAARWVKTRQRLERSPAGRPFR